MDAGVHGGNGEPRPPGDLRTVQLLQKAQFQHGAVGLRHGSEHGNDVARVPYLWGGEVGLWVQGDRAPGGAEVGEGGVLDQGDHPGQPLLLRQGEEPLGVLDALEPGGLGDVLCLVGVLHPGKGIAI